MTVYLATGDVFIDEATSFDHGFHFVYDGSARETFN